MILAIDQGTTGTTCLVVDDGLAGPGPRLPPSRRSTPQPGWVEHDPAGDLVERRARPRRPRSPTPGSAAGDLAAIGITNQRETTVVWDRASGEPVHRGDRLAGPAHGGALRASCRPSRSAPSGPGSSATLLLGHEARVDPRRVETGAQERARVRHGRHLARLAADRRRASTSPTRRTRRGRCCSTSRRARGSDELLRPLRRRPRAAPGACGARPEVVGGGVAARRDASRSPGIAGDQQAALFGQALLRAGRGEGDATAPGRSCSWPPGGDCSAPRARASLRTAAAIAAGAPAAYALEGSVLRRGRGAAVAARRARRDRRRGGERGARARGAVHRAASSSCRR